MYTDFRLKILHFIRKNKRILLIGFLIWVVIFIINMFLKNYTPPVIPETTYTPHVSVMNSDSSVPKGLQQDIENLIEEYIGYCNDGNYQMAYKMLSEDCKKYEFDNNLTNFQQYVLTKMPNPKRHSIQNYSNDGDRYTYQIKYTDDFLATGLTNEKYSYTEEKISFEIGNDGTILMSSGNFIRKADIKSVIENDYLKVDIVEKIVRYSLESYRVKLTNRSDFIIVIADGIEQNEVVLQLSQEYRNRLDIDNNIVLQPKESIELVLEFTKFSDAGDKSQNIIFNAVRVMEQYSGITVDAETILKEIENAISKFSVKIPLIESK